MVQALDESMKKQVKMNFEEWLDLIEARKETNANITALITSTSTTLNVKKPIISKLFKFLQEQHENGEDTVNDIASLMNALTS